MTPTHLSEEMCKNLRMMVCTSPAYILPSLPSLDVGNGLVSIVGTFLYRRKDHNSYETAIPKDLNDAVEFGTVEQVVSLVKDPEAEFTLKGANLFQLFADHCEQVIMSTLAPEGVPPVKPMDVAELRDKFKITEVAECASDLPYFQQRYSVFTNKKIFRENVT